MLILGGGSPDPPD